MLDTIARHAAQLSGSDDAIVGVRDGDRVVVAAHHGDIPMLAVGEGIQLNRGSVAGRSIMEGRTIQAVHREPGSASEYPEGNAVAKRYGYRVTCSVPLMREGEAVGAIGIRRINAEPLDEKQIAVIQSFANQAAIALGNVRQFNETKRLLKETEQRSSELARHQQHSAGDGGASSTSRRSSIWSATNCASSSGPGTCPFAGATRMDLSAVDCIRTSTASG